MTDCVVDIALTVPTEDGPDVPAAGYLQFKPTARRDLEGTIVLPEPFVVDLDEEGEAQVTLAPTESGTWAWTVREYVVGGGRRLVDVPDGPGPVDYDDLVDVDPATLDPTAPIPPVWLEYVNEKDAELQANIQTGDATNAQDITDEVLRAQGIEGDLRTDLDDHTGDTSNPHSVTKAQVGLGSVDDTSDAAKPISTAAAAALGLKADLVGGLVPTSQIPAIAIGTGQAVANRAAMLALTNVQQGDFVSITGTSDKGTYILNDPDPSVFGHWMPLSVPTDVVQSVNGQNGIIVLGKSDVGLSHADDTSDVDKPVSTAQGIINAALLSADTAEATTRATALIDSDAQRRLDRDWLGRRQRNGGAASIEYADSTEYTEDWTGTTNVLKATNGQVSGNKFYATNATAPGGWNKAFSLSLAAGARWRLTTLLYYKASGAASTYFGINCGVSGKALAANDPDSIVMGITSGNVRSVSLGSNLSAINLLNQGSLGSNPSSSDKVYQLTIEADDEDISFTLKGIGTIDDVVIWSFEKASLTALGKTINNLSCYITDSRGTSGNAFGPFIVQTNSIQQPRTKTIASQVIHGQDYIQRRTSTGTISATNAFVTTLPKTYDARKPHPLVIWHEQSVTGSAWDMFEESRVQALTQALLDAGYIIVGCNDPASGGGNSFGNQAQLDKFGALYAMAIQHYNVGPWFGVGASMGGLSLANCISKRVLPTPAAAAVVGGSFDIGHAWDLGAPFDALVETAYSASGRADLITKSTGYDPIRGKTSDFRGVPWRLYTSAADPYQPTARQQAFADIVSPGAPEAGVVVASGGHLDPSQYQASDVLAFFRRYGGI